MKICISSTFLDLINYRNMALEVCDIFKAKQLAMEIIFSTNDNPIKESLKLVQDSDIYICIIGEKYGTIKDGYSKSITHLEYDEAIRINKPIYIFVVSSTNRDKEMKKLLSDIKENHTYSHIESVIEFRKALLNTIRNNHFKELKINSKFILDLEAEHIQQNDHGLAMDFISNKNTLDLLNIFSENISGMENMLNYISDSNQDIENDLIQLFKKLNIDEAKIKKIPYYENPFINRDWEMVNLGFPNWLNSVKLSFLNLKVRLLEYEVQQSNDEVLYKELTLAKKELTEFIGVSHVD